MSSQNILHVPVREETYNLYMQRYRELKMKDGHATHDTLMKSLLGFRD